MNTIRHNDMGLKNLYFLTGSRGHNKMKTSHKFVKGKTTVFTKISISKSTNKKIQGKIYWFFSEISKFKFYKRKLKMEPKSQLNNCGVSSCLQKYLQKWLITINNGICTNICYKHLMNKQLVLHKIFKYAKHTYHNLAFLNF